MWGDIPMVDSTFKIDFVIKSTYSYHLGYRLSLNRVDEDVYDYEVDHVYVRKLSGYWYDRAVKRLKRRAQQYTLHEKTKDDTDGGVLKFSVALIESDK